MVRLRLLLLRHPALALGVMLAALSMKLLVPAGYMPDSGAGRVLTLRVCEESSGSQVTRAIVVPVTGEQGTAPARKQAGDTCPFAGHGSAALAGADLLLLALALAFALVRGFAPVHRPAARIAARLRPPLRAPPARV